METITGENRHSTNLTNTFLFSHLVDDFFPEIVVRRLVAMPKKKNSKSFFAKGVMMSIIYNSANLACNFIYMQIVYIYGTLAPGMASQVKSSCKLFLAVQIFLSFPQI
jgi:hypothetical protein